MRKNRKWKGLLAAMVCCMAMACQQMPEDGEMVSDDGQEHPLKVQVRSAGDAELVYPLYLYAFSEKGSLVASQTIEDKDKEMSLTMSKGDFQIVALSGISDAYQLPDSPDLDDGVTLKGNQGADTPLMAGRANVEIGDASEASAQITLKYVVAALNVKLKDVPSNVTAVQLAISPLYSTLSMGGEYGGDSQKVKVDCSLVTDGVWAAETTYIFPGSGKETVFSIYFKTAEGAEVTYGYTYKGAPEANHLFNLTGSYSGGVIVGGNFDVTNWEGSIDVEFEFGAEVVPDDDDDDDDNTDIKVEGVPEIGTIWEDMIVAAISDVDETGADLLLMALDEWSVTTSEVEAKLEAYNVDGASGWRLPTDEEAKTLRARFNGDELGELNERIAELDGEWKPVSDGDDVRYLCLKGDVYYSFRFVNKTTTTKAGDVRKYNLRPVKTYRFSLEE